MAGNPSPEPLVWLGSAITYRWVNSLFRISKNGVLQQSDLFDLPDEDLTRLNAARFEESFNERIAKTPEEKRTRKFYAENLKWSLWGIVRDPLIIAGILRLVNSLVQLAVPFAVAEFLEFVAIADELDDSEKLYGFYWAALLGGIYMLKALIENRFFWMVSKGGWMLRSTMSSAVFNKSLKLSSSARQSLSQGQIVNLMQLDAEKLERFAPNLHVFWDSALQIIGYCAVIYFYIEESVFIGLAVLLLTIPLQAYLFMKLAKYLRSFAVYTDERVKLCNEAMISILAIKSAGWELNFEDRIKGIRDTELSQLRDSLIIRSLMMAIITSIPNITAAAGLSYFGLTRGDDAVTAAILFASIQGFNSLRFPLFQIPNALTTYTDAKVSQYRLAAFLGLPESSFRDADGGDEDKKKEEKGDDTGGNIVVIREAEFFWTSADAAVDNILMDEKKDGAESQGTVEHEAALRDINLVIPQGALVGVVGPVGSGKSTLLNAILGEMEITKGTLDVSSTSAYAAQSAWIQNASLRDNILFGLEMNRRRYQKVLDVCQLRNDLDILQDGDSTIIGERGINLSGGQAQRVSVARAAYSHSELVLLDDPLSALDPEVAAKMFDDCILEFLKGRTRVMVTNQLNFLEECDYVVVLGPEEGHLAKGEPRISPTNGILMQGTFEELMQANKDFKELLSSFQTDEEDVQEDLYTATRVETLYDEQGNPRETTVVTAHELIQVEERETGAVKWKYYWTYFKAAGSCLFFLGMFFLLVGQLSSLTNTFLLSFWADDPLYEEQSLEFYLAVYAGSAVFAGFIYFCQTYIFYYLGVRASKKFHIGLLNGVFSAPMSFFDTTPTGRIVARFSRDVFSLDTELPPNLVFFLFFFGSAVSAVIAIASQLPLFLVVVPFTAAVYYYIVNQYRPIARDVKRLESVSRSPIYAHFGETLSGLSSIRAYNKVDEFIHKCEYNIDESLKATYVFKALERWIAVRLELLSALIIAISAALLAYVIVYQDALSAGLAGVVLNLVLMFTGLMSGIVRGFVTVETIFNSVERLDYYSNQIEREESFTSDNPPDTSWPREGQITFSNVFMKYREETPLVLKGVELEIPGGSSVGVVGRTGCGKSSLMLTLLRVVEVHSGSIHIDGVDISTIGLHELRHKISMVPQSPVMFSGTVRLNLDPFGSFDDDRLWEVLKQVNLFNQIFSLQDQLDAKVVEYGQNFSQGQRQLMCMARSLLANTKILLLDEATSSVDYETDALIQQTIREQFTGCTILTIAHRVQTIADYDNVLVMVEGAVGEFDSPANLLSQSNSEFSKIVAETGSNMSAKIREQVFKGKGE